MGWGKDAGSRLCNTIKMLVPGGTRSGGSLCKCGGKKKKKIIKNMVTGSKVEWSRTPVSYCLLRRDLGLAVRVNVWAPCKAGMFPPLIHQRCSAHIFPISSQVA